MWIDQDGMIHVLINVPSVLLKETVKHLLWECPKSARIWNALTNWFKRKWNCIITLTYKIVAFCNYEGPHQTTINLVVMLFKHYIYTSKCKKEQISFLML